MIHCNMIRFNMSRQPLPRRNDGQPVPIVRHRRFAYTLYAAALFLITALPVWLMLLVLPDLSRRRAWARRYVRAVAGLCGITLAVTGSEHIPRDRPVLLVANHSSYLDGLVLQAALTCPFGFVVKQELRRNPFTGWLLRRLGAQFVERFDAERSLQDTLRITRQVRSGQGLLFFPEGTFKAEPGLLPFRLGAFVIAVRTRTPVVPITVRGTRALLPAHRWTLEPGPIDVTVHPLIEPPGSSWEHALRLRDQVRMAILRTSAEPDLTATHLAREHGV